MSDELPHVTMETLVHLTPVMLRAGKHLININLDANITHAKFLMTIGILIVVR